MHNIDLIKNEFEEYKESTEKQIQMLKNEIESLNQLNKEKIDKLVELTHENQKLKTKPDITSLNYIMQSWEGYK